MARSTKASLVLRTAALLTAVWLAGGCGGGGQSQPATHTVSGTVRFNDKVVNYGSVAFYGGDGRPVKSVIQTDGSYNIRNPPLGEVKVAVETGPPPVLISPPGGKGGEPFKFEKIDIPLHYSDPEKTDLRYTVTPGQHRFDINLKPDPQP
jgi:hypothetical protein